MNNNEKFKDAFKAKLQNYKHSVKDGMWDDIANSLPKQSIHTSHWKRTLSWAAMVAIVATITFAAVYTSNIISHKSPPADNEYVNPKKKKNSPEMRLENDEETDPNANSNEETEAAAVITKEKAKKTASPTHKIEMVDTPKRDAPQDIEKYVPLPNKPNEEREDSDNKMDTIVIAKDTLAQAQTKHEAILEEAMPEKPKKDYSSWSFAISSKNMLYTGYRKQWGSMELPAEATATDDVIGWKRKFSHPVNINLMVRKQLNKRFAIEGGLSYTYLWSTETKVNSISPSTNTNIEMHNVGIPLAVEYTLLSKSKMQLYGKWGAMIEKTDGANKRIGEWQLSTSLSGVIGYRLSQHWGLFAEPGLSYYFGNGSSLPTLRNEAPLNFDVSAGIRFYPFSN